MVIINIFYIYIYDKLTIILFFTYLVKRLNRGKGRKWENKNKRSGRNDGLAEIKSLSTAMNNMKRRE